MRNQKGEEPFSPVCVFGVRRLLKVGEGAGAEACATGVGWEMRSVKQPISPVCVSWVRRLLKEGGEGAGAGAGATGAALFLRLLRGWSSSGFLADLPLIFALVTFF